MATTSITIRMDEALKHQAELMFNDMGMNMTTAMNIFVKAVVRQGKIPFEISSDIPNAVTLAAMEEIESGKAKRFDSAQALFEDLNDDTD